MRLHVSRQYRQHYQLYENQPHGLSLSSKRTKTSYPSLPTRFAGRTEQVSGIEEGTDITPQVFLMLERFRKANRDFGGTSTILITGLCRRPFKGNQHGFDMRQDETIWRAKSPTLSASTYDGVLSLPQMGIYVQGHG